MRIFISANALQEEEIKKKKTDHQVELLFSDVSQAKEHLDSADALFILDQPLQFVNSMNLPDKPIIVHSVIETLSEAGSGKNVSRINAWPGFLERDVWEIASGSEQETQKIFDSLNWKAIFVKDKAGLVAARVISMIINEAFYALGEKISTIDEIDMAMKLGTNYPYGPFEWADKIGLKNIYDLLLKLKEENTRYLPAAALIQAFERNFYK